MTETYNPFSLEGKQILVTGASSGIGKATALACAKMGASVILNGRNIERLNEVMNLLPEGEHKVMAADLSDREAVTLMVKPYSMQGGNKRGHRLYYGDKHRGSHASSG